MAIHIGNLIQERLAQRGMSKSEFARRIGKARQNINDILRRQSLDTEVLYQASIALQYDFFQHYALQLQNEGVKSDNPSELMEMTRKYHEQNAKLIGSQKDNERMEMQVKLLSEQVDTLNELVDLYRESYNENKEKQ